MNIGFKIENLDPSLIHLRVGVDPERVVCVVYTRVMKLSLGWQLGVAALLVGCGDDGGSQASSDGSSTGPAATATASATDPTGGPTTASDTAPTTDSPTTDASTTDAPTTDAPTTDASSSGGGSSDGSDSGSSSGGPQVILLQNDVWEDGDPVAVQGGFSQGECWAATYVPEPEHYPFRLRGINVLIGGDEDGVMENFEVSVWNVDETLLPSTQVDTATASFTAASEEFNVAEFELLGFEEQVIDDGNFAIALCFADHGGFPGIAADVGGTLIEDRNWLFTAGAWSPSATFGLQGNWVMRAIIETM